MMARTSRSSRAARWAALGLALICAPTLAFAQEPAKIPARDLLADFAILRRAYEELHPGLYRYNTRPQMDAAFATLRSQLDRDQTLPEAYLAISTFLAKVRCGHTYANFFNQPKAIAESLLQAPGRVPFHFRWLDRRMIVTRSLSDEPKLARGTEILAIDGVPVATILDRLMTVARADGSNDAKRAAYLELNGDSRYEAFDIYYPLMFPPKGEGLELRIKPPGGAEATVNVPRMSYARRLDSVSQAEKARKADEPVWELRYLDDRTACLKMPTWALFDSKWDWKKFLDESFEEFGRRKIETLVIDLRGNEGGLSVGDVLLEHLTKADFSIDGYRRMVRYRKVPDDLVPYLDTWDKSFRDWGDAAVPDRDGFFRMTKYDDDAQGTRIKARPRPFAGRTFVLVDASNSSATFEFARAAQKAKLATLVGQPTGGNLRGINGGAFFFLRLPKSKIEVDLPLIAQFPMTDQPDEGVKPDILVRPTADDIARGVDAELAAVMASLRSSSPPTR